MRLLAVLFLYLASGLFLSATVVVVRAKKRLKPLGLIALNHGQGCRGLAELSLTVLFLAIALQGVARFGIRSAPIVSLPLFVFVLISEAFDLVRLLREHDELSPEARREMVIPGALALLGIGCWTIGCLLTLV